MKRKYLLAFLIGIMCAAEAAFAVTRIVVCEESYKSL